MTLYEKIKSIYPELDDRDFMTLIILQNDSDGKGDYIAKWQHPNFTIPTKEQLDALDVQTNIATTLTVEGA